MLTGEYAWRKSGTGILPGNAALIVEPGRTTLASVFQRGGYATGVVGKWHLGLGPAGGPNWNGEIRPGPTDIGFDSAFIMAATGDRVPTVYVENRHVVGLDPADPISVSYGQPSGDSPTGRENPNLLKLHPSHGHDQTIVNGISRIGHMTGGKAARWKDEDMADVFTRKATAFIEQRNADRTESIATIRAASTPGSTWSTLATSTAAATTSCCYLSYSFWKKRRDKPAECSEGGSRTLKD